MKAVLVKKAECWYNLYQEEIGFASTHWELQGYKLCQENCDEIFGVLDVEKLAIDEIGKRNLSGQIYNNHEISIFIKGFNKAMELNKDKLFTLEDMRKAIDWTMNQYFEFHESPAIGRREHYLQLLQQPPDIEVEIEMETISEGLDENAQPQFKQSIKLDEKGCLILKKAK